MNYIRPVFHKGLKRLTKIDRSSLCNYSSMTTSKYSVISNNLEKPDIDNRQYEIIQLENKLIALLINDPTTDKSAAALDVNVGAFNDPKNLPGLAHFCEHLLFMGTAKYPSENEYSSYLSKNSGFSNAFTSSVHTNYYFEIANHAMEGALDRFAQFFISPTFDPSCKDREIKAVDSENKKNLQNDNWRLYQLSKSTTNPKHPYNGFSTGNKITLGETPLAEGLDVRNELLKFHDKLYSSNLMRLVVVSNEPIDTLKKWTVEKFSPIVNKDVSKPIFAPSPFDSDEYIGNFIKAKPIMESRSLQLSFPIPDSQPFWKSLPCKYLSHLLGHESKGSLLYSLKEKGWANGLSAGNVNVSPGYSDFVVEVELTSIGLSNYQEIVKDIFKYIKMLQLQGPQEWIFKEMQDQALSAFKFRQKSGASGTASRLAGSLHNLQFYNVKIDEPINESNPPEIVSIPPEYLLSSTLIREYDPSLISKFANHLNPSNFRTMLVAKEIFNETNSNDIQKEKWYGTEYISSRLDETLVNELNDIYYRGLGLDGAYSLPERNNFIPTDFELVEDNNNSTSIVYPKLIQTNNDSKIWYKVNTKLGGPRSAVTLKFNLPGSTSTPLNSLLMSLFVEMLDDDLNSTSYLASIAGLSYEVNVAREGLSMDVIGYSHKLENLLDAVVNRLISFTDPNQIDQIWNKERSLRFDAIKEKLSKSLKNFGYSVPYNQVGPIISGLINEGSWLVDDEIDSLDMVNFNSLKYYAANLLNICFIEVLIVGNYSKKHAITISQYVEEQLTRSLNLTQSQFTRGRSLNLPKDHTYHYVKKNDDTENINSCIEVFLQCGEIANEKSERVMAELIGQILHEPFFNRLRTNEQLGYVVFSGLRETRTTFGLRLLIQSERPTAYLLTRINKFLIKMGHKINLMSEEEFNKYVKSVISKKQQKVKNLREERSRFWNRIATGYYDFDRRETDVEILNNFTLTELKDYYSNMILNKQSHGSLVVHLQSQIVPEQSISSVVKASISNFIYNYPEFDSIEYPHNEIDAVVDRLTKGDTKFDSEIINSVISNEVFVKAFPDFKYTKNLVDYVSNDLNTDYSIIKEDSNNAIIGQTGEWKCQVPLTKAPSAKVLNDYLDEDYIDSKL